MSLDAINDVFSVGDETKKGGVLVHIRAQQRSKKKAITTVQGISEELDPKKILKAMKKEFGCNGTVVSDEDLGEVIQLQGDQRQSVSDFLVAMKLFSQEEIQMHGF
ncbi:MAG: translation initiation factor eIF1 [Amphiamblys sp. WSBS2006]|nr:MAG: translation initiation factor eIF1 [Amphiamblys sp. WSBS2006]